MSKLVGTFKLGDKKNTFYIIEDGKNIDTIYYEIENINKELFSLLNKYTIDKIEFIGMPKYSMGLGQEFQKQLLTKYNRTIEIEYK